MTARSLLYVPGTRSDRFDKAASSGADAIILDLEDAVPWERKDEARDAVCAWVRAHAPDEGEVWVRINGGDLRDADARAVTDAGARNVVLPKATLSGVRALEPFGVQISALLETAEGVLDARAIAEHRSVVRLGIGEADLGAELAIEASPDAREMWASRALVVLASSAAGIDAPVGPVSTDFTDLDAFRDSTAAIKRAGFGARAAIHPAQVAVINEVFTPTDREIADARALLARFEAAGGGVCLDDQGRMVDEAIVRSARRTLARAREDG